jgi:predicted nucleotidyltransferase
MLAISDRKPIDALVSASAAVHLRAFADDLAKALGSTLSGVVLFGSRARGDARKGSDYDVAVIVRSIDNRRVLDHLLSDIAYPHVLDGIHIRPLALEEGYLDRTRENALAASIVRDGIVLA